MKKYKIEYSGFAYVEAVDEEDARWGFDPADSIFSEWVIDNLEEVDELPACLYEEGMV